MSRRRKRKTLAVRPRWPRQVKLTLAMILVTVVFVVVIVVVRSLSG